MWVTDRRRLSSQETERETYSWWTSHELVKDSNFCQPNEVHHGESSTYTWDVQNKHGPGPNDPSSIVWSYQSHVGGNQMHHHSGGQGVGDVNAGLIGPVIISKRGSSRHPYATGSGASKKAANLMPTGMCRNNQKSKQVLPESNKNKNLS